ncbi:MAG: hypothetical protein CM15mP40_11500 [Alphaproteobacteria bacterium]|nr:MAG: hypothetical protein CM15mP40_11500 [Alphaproteobacteria bacterium]
MNLTPAIIKELREKSGAGMMDCKKALTNQMEMLKRQLNG